MIFCPTVFLARGDEKKLSVELRCGLVERLYGKPFEIATQKSGKPVIKAEDDIGISISHRDGLVAFLITPFSPCGIDIEKTKGAFPERVKKSYLTESDTPDECFLEWCKREAYVKMTGEGLSGLKKVPLCDDGVFFLDLSESASKLLGERTTLAVCTKENIKPQIILIT